MNKRPHNYDHHYPHNYTSLYNYSNGNIITNHQPH